MSFTCGLIHFNSRLVSDFGLFQKYNKKLGTKNNGHQHVKGAPIFEPRCLSRLSDVLKKQAGEALKYARGHDLGL